MRFIKPGLHGIIDYFAVSILIMIPWYSGFTGIALGLPVSLGVIALFYTIFTDFSLGFKPLLSLKTHLLIDLIGGAFLALSPFIFGFSEAASLFHFQFGIGVVIVVALTDCDLF
ncbi:MAG: hypothetical protein O3C63_05810 [Cyanobacteria bacterium]|nr:hypothetical protein [Cyanobacteriota bacterium]MDA1020831.1 hypothetical protein [Cyanobacteriota bacterium]